VELYNLGCGLKAPIGWHNLDRSPNLLLDRLRPLKVTLHKLGFLDSDHMASWPRNVRFHDIRKGVPCAEGSADAIYSSHTLEHLYLEEAHAVIGSCYRALRSGGVLRIALPDGQAFARYGVAGDPESALHYNRKLAAHPLNAPTIPQRIRRVVASPPHRWQPTAALAIFLFSHWFDHVDERTFRQGALPDLQSVEHRCDSIFVEGIKN
jgi:SAM-dependent methyltransferase